MPLKINDNVQPTYVRVDCIEEKLYFVAHGS